MIGISLAEVQERFPGAFEALVEQRQRDHFESRLQSRAMIAYVSLFTVSEGKLWVEDDVPTDAAYWDPALGWVEQDGTVSVRKVK